MTTWSNMMFPDANSPIMEQMIFFHDHSMIILMVTMIIISYMMINLMMNKMTNRLMMEGQDVEVMWTMTPAMMLMFIALPSLRLLYLMEEMFKPSMTMKIIGHQWYWSYEYADFNLMFDSFMLPHMNLTPASFRLLDTDNRLILPFNNNTRFLITSADVIHAWSIPSLGLKIDAIPGRLNQMNTLMTRPGLYFGQCSEICGANHSFMPITLEAINTIDFIKWMKTY